MDAPSPPQHRANAFIQPQHRHSAVHPGKHQTPLARLGNVFPAPDHCPMARSRSKPPWAKLGRITADRQQPSPHFSSTPAAQGGGPSTEPSNPGGKQRLKSGMTTATSNTKQDLCWDPTPDHAPGRENTMFKWGPGRTTSVRDENIFPNSTYSPQKKAIPLRPSDWPCHQGQTSPVTLTRCGGSDTLSHPFPPLGNAAADNKLLRRFQQRRAAQAVLLPCMSPWQVAQSQAQIQHRQGVSTSLIPSSTMHATLVCSSTSGHASSPSPQGIKGSYLPPCGPPGPPDSRALLPTSTGPHSSPVPSGASGFVLGRWGKVGRR